MRWVWLVPLLLVALLAAGCAALPAVRPVTVRQQVLAHPGVAPWFEQHSAPAVLDGLGPARAKAYRRYKPAVTVDLVREGLLVKLQSRFGAEPRRMEVLVDRESGAVLQVKPR